MGKIFDFEIFVLNHVSKHSESIPTKKNFSTRNFWLCHFFTILVILGKKTKFKEKKFVMGKNFRFRDFRFKIRFETFRIEPDQKNVGQNFLTLPFFHYFCQKWLCLRNHFVMEIIRPKFFTFVIFSLYLPKNDLVPRKNFTREKIFDFEIFILKYVSKHSESIPTKKNFRPIFFDFAIFHHFGPKTRFLKFLGSKKISKKFFSPSS